MPKPLQKPRVPIMNAGGSPRGMRFAAEHADLCFVILRSDDPATWCRQVETYKRMAAEEFGRKVQVWTYCPVVQRATQAEAEAYLHHYAVEMEDGPSLDAWSAGLGAQARPQPGTKLSLSQLEAQMFHVSAGKRLSSNFANCPLLPPRRSEVSRTRRASGMRR